MHIGRIGQKSAAFIIHKPFHPGSFKNLEKVWIAEQKHAEAKRKQEDLLDQRIQEGKIEELRRALHAGDQAVGSSSFSDSISHLRLGGDASQNIPAHLAREISNHKLDWMYHNAAAGKNQTTERFQLEGTLGADENPRTHHLDTEDNHEDFAHNGTSDAGKSVTNIMYAGLSESDMLRKVKEDPMFAIKQAELAHQKAMGNNPLIRAKLQEKEQRREERRRVREERQAMKVQKKKAKREYSSDSDEPKHNSNPKQRRIGVQADDDTINTLRAESGIRESERLGPTDVMINSLNERRAQREVAISSSSAEKEDQPGSPISPHGNGLDAMICRAEKNKEARRERVNESRRRDEQSKFRDKRLSSRLDELDGECEPTFIRKARKEVMHDHIERRRVR